MRLQKSIVGTAAVGNSSDLSVKTLLEPVIGLGTSYQFVKAAATVAERRQRIATLAAFLSTSITAIGTDPNTNIAVGAAIGSKISYMRAILARGGGSQHILNPSLKDFTIVADSRKTLMVHPYRAQFTDNCKISINNMFQEHTARRYSQGCIQKVKRIRPSYVVPVASIQISINTTALIGWTVFGVGLIGFTTLGVLYLTQRAERKPYQNKNDKLLIERTVSQ